jgi:hypothetical protein
MPQPQALPQLPSAYRGRHTPEGAVVEAQTPAGAWHLLDPRLDLCNHSPTGFEWGYAGSGPAQLALALAASRLPDALARTVYQRLKRALIAGLCKHWHLTAADLDDLLAGLLSNAIAGHVLRPSRRPPAVCAGGPSLLADSQRNSG